MSLMSFLLFTDRAISYRVDKGFDHFAIALSIGVQRMVHSDLASAGVMFSLDTETGFRENDGVGLACAVLKTAVAILEMEKTPVR